MFDELMTDYVTLVKATGERSESLRASVQSELIFTQDATVTIEDGDTFERTLPSGVVEIFEILDAGFHSEVASIPAHYQSRVRKRTARSKAPSTQHVVYNLIGPNARINIESTDLSTNVVSVDSAALFASLRVTIKKSIPDSTLATTLVERVDGMEAAVGTSRFAERYKEFIAVTADHIGVFGPFLPALTQLLAG